MNKKMLSSNSCFIKGFQKKNGKILLYFQNYALVDDACLKIKYRVTFKQNGSS